VLLEEAMALEVGNTLLDRIQALNEVGIALSTELNIDRLLEKILQNAKLFTRADGGTVYTVSPNKTLSIDIMWTDSLNYHLGGTAKERISFPPLPLFFEDGSMNHNMVVTHAVNQKKVVNIKDAYTEEGFDFSGTKEFDKGTGYRTKAVLVVPIKDNEGDVIAVLQLINPIDAITKEVTTFVAEDVQLAESLASQAGVALSNQRLVENLRLLFESFIQVIAQAIDKKSPVTGNHGRRVPIISDLLARAVNEADTGRLARTHFTEEDLYELKVAAFLHDCGKITTPVHVVEKKNKLETICDRMPMIEARYEVMKLRAEKELSSEAYTRQIQEYEEELSLLTRLNEIREPVTNEVKKRVRRIAERKWKGDQPLLSENEIENLLIEKGNLTEAERQIIENHVVMTIEMLHELIYPKDLARVPEIAGAHHEWINGKGYPRQLKGDQMSCQAKILAIADVFEALSAPDRPYKQAMKLSTVLKVMKEMVEEGHLDKDLFDLFCQKKVYLNYAADYLSPEQIDVVF
jgi:HD-GYP domain-containing protein (c-di-GMP phosphodiesterase class II)